MPHWLNEEELAYERHCKLMDGEDMPIVSTSHSFPENKTVYCYRPNEGYEVDLHETSRLDPS